MAKRPVIPVAVGQIRRDPRRPDRCVRVVEVGVPSVYVTTPVPAARVEAPHG